MADCFFIKEEFKICSLTENNQGLNEYWDEADQARQNLMLILICNKHAFLVFVLEQKVDALQTFCFQLIYLVIKNLEPCDVDNAVVVWRIWDLNTNAKSSDEN